MIFASDLVKIITSFSDYSSRLLPLYLLKSTTTTTTISTQSNDVLEISSPEILMFCENGMKFNVYVFSFYRFSLSVSSVVFVCSLFVAFRYSIKNIVL